MPYAATLDRLIKESGMTAKDIAERCKDFGVDITPSYISLLRNPKKGRVASDEISIALAKVLGKPDKQLVLERCIDEAPEELSQVFHKIYKASAVFAAAASKRPLSSEELDSLDVLISQEPISDLILKLNEEYETDSLTQMANSFSGSKTVTGSKFSQQLKMLDNSMHPIIKKNDVVNIVLNSDIANGEIIAVQMKKGIMLRRYEKISDVAVLIAVNPQYPTMQFDSSMKILGQAVSVTSLI